MVAHLWTDVHQILVAIDLPLRESHFHLLKITNSLPAFLPWRAQNFEDLEQLVDLALALEEGPSSHHFEKDATE